MDELFQRPEFRGLNSFLSLYPGSGFKISINVFNFKSSSVVMPYFIDKNEPNMITVRFDGVVNLGERKNAVDEVCELVNLNAPVNLLVDVRNIIMDMTKDEQKYFGQYLASKKELSDAKVALVHIPSNNPNKIINAVAYTEGYEVVDFDCLNHANEWLTGNIK